MKEEGEEELKVEREEMKAVEYVMEAKEENDRMRRRMRRKTKRRNRKRMKRKMRKRKKRKGKRKTKFFNVKF